MTRLSATDAPIGKLPVIEAAYSGLHALATIDLSVRIRHVGADKIHASIPEVYEEGCVAAQPVELSNNEFGAMQATCGQRLRQLGPIASACQAPLPAQPLRDRLPAHPTAGRTDRSR